jgi:hypothetical protein
MAKRKRDPREEKVLDYLNQTANDYGENDKSSRKAIRLRKAWVNRTYRREVKAITARGAADDIDDESGGVRRSRWKKSPDRPLALDVEKRRGQNDETDPAPISPARHEALRRLRRKGRRRLRHRGID